MSYSFIEYNGMQLVSPEPPGEPASNFNINFSGVGDHLIDSSNPHSVTLSQIGAWYKDITFILGDELEVGDDLTNHVPLVASGYFQSTLALMKTAPSGGDINFSIQKNGEDIQNITVPDLDTSGNSSDFIIGDFLANDYLSINVDHIGSGYAGFCATVVLSLEYMN